MRLTYCDWCKREITTDSIYTQTIKDENSKNALPCQEICAFCKEDLREYINSKRDKHAEG